MTDFAPGERPAPTMVTGLRDTGQTNSTRIVADVSDTLYRYRNSAAPLTTLSTKVKDPRIVHYHNYKMLSVDEEPRIVQSSAGYTPGDTSIVLASGHGDRIVANTVLMNLRTREHILVTSIPVADTPTVRRGIGSTAVDIVAGDQFLITRAVFEDGSDIGTLKSIAEDDDENNTEIIRTPYGWTRRDEDTEMYGGSDPASTRRTKGIEHKKSIEYMMYFGRRYSMTGAGGKLQTFSGGLEYFIRSNVWDLDGNVPSERAWLEFLEEAMRWGDAGFEGGGEGNKYFFAPTRWVSTINNWAQDRIQYSPSDKTMGIKIGKYQTPFGDLMLIHSPILDAHHQDMGFIVDLNHFRAVYHKGGKTKIQTDRQNPGVDGYIEEYLSDVGTEVVLEASHAIVRGLAV